MSLQKGAEVVLKDCMGVKQKEKVLIVTDDEKEEIGRALYEAASKISDNTVMVLFKPRDISGTEPPAQVAEAMKNSDLVICPIKAFLTHTRARLDAVARGARVTSSGRPSGRTHQIDRRKGKDRRY